MQQFCSLAFVLLLLLANKVTAQDNYCGTTMSEQQIKWLKTIQQNPPQFRNNELYYIPIQYHLVGTSDGKGHYSIQSALNQLCTLNEQYKETGFYFFLYNNDIKKINNSTFYIHTFGNTNSMMSNNVDGAVNVYMVEDPAGNCGYFSPGPDGLSVAKSCAGANATTLAHEMGHYFDLPHTFNGWEGRDINDPPNTNFIENVARSGSSSNCHQSGDFFCDTPADYISDRWNCPYNLDWEDPTGVKIDPDGSLYMSYSNDGCQEKFSKEQMAVMHQNLLQQRNYLITDVATLNMVDIAETHQIYPGHLSTNVPIAEVHFTWEAVLGASRYNLSIIAPSQSLTYDLLVDGNSFTLTDLAPETKYYWKVAAFNEGNYCINYPSTFTFETAPEGNAFSMFLSDINTTMPSCKGANDASIAIQVQGAVMPYTVVWEDGTMGTSLSDITAGSYVCTITDANNKQQTFTVNITEPDELSLDFSSIIGDEVSIDIEGGTAPYSIVWSDGSNGKVNNDLQAGVNTVEITDSRGCTISGEINHIKAAVVISSPITCADLTDGFAIVSGVEGGVPPYHYLWSNGEKGYAANNLEAGDNQIIVVVDANDCITTQNFTVSTQVGLEDYTKNNAFTLNRNILPQGENIEWINKMECGDKIQIEITNINGQIVYQANQYFAEKNTISTQNLSTGLYFLRLRSCEQQTVAKIILF